MTLRDFLLDRIAEDEAVARYLTSDYARHKPAWRNPSTGVVDLGDPGMDGLQALGDGPLASHVARWDPARVLAECEAKRRVVASTTDEQTLRLLAAPYNDHPDWRNEWNAENCPTPG